MSGVRLSASPDALATSGQASDEPIGGALARGLAILRCFMPGREVLSHTELAELTGMPKSTVSRLTTALLHTGFLLKTPDGRFAVGYAALSLTSSSLGNCRFIHDAKDEIAHITQRFRANVGVSVPYDVEMIYVYVAYGDDTRLSRRLVPGSRKRLESNAIGHAYVASLDARTRRALLRRMKQRHPETWCKYESMVLRSLAAFDRSGYCELRWQHGTISFATPFTRDGLTYVVNISVSDTKERTAASLRGDVVKALKRLRSGLQA